jgi:hypothetical protein
MKTVALVTAALLATVGAASADCVGGMRESYRLHLYNHCGYAVTVEWRDESSACPNWGMCSTEVIRPGGSTMIIVTGYAETRNHPF